MMGQNMFYGEIWLIIPKLSLLPLLIWSTVMCSFLCQKIVLQADFICYLESRMKQNFLHLVSCINFHLVNCFYFSGIWYVIENG